MHDIPDTEEADAAAERLWPEEPFRQLLREKLHLSFCRMLTEAGAFASLYEAVYTDRFDDYDMFVQRLSEIVVIGAENGADRMFGEIYASFRSDGPLPLARDVAVYLWPLAFDEALKVSLQQKIIDEYKELHAYIHIHEEHYQGTLSFQAFLEKIADLVVSGAVNGADDALGGIYRSFLNKTPLPAARRHSRRAR
jgi:hypothetical protein